ncbi:MAG: L-aspartate oxidase [bacterium]
MRYLLDPETQEFTHESSEILIVGSGVAGLRSALELAEDYTVTIITKASIKSSNTNWAQGGIAAVVGDHDNYESHIQDTLEAGAGLCDEPAVRRLVRNGPDQVRQLMDWGADFDRIGDELDLGREGGHSKNRIVHGRGDATGSLVEDTLVNQVQHHPRITVFEESMMVDIVADNDRAYGLLTMDRETTRVIWCRGLILATGGLGQLFRETTNHNIATGDGMAAGFRAGLTLRDMEFVQFHPTTLYVAGGPRFLISEAVRGEGAILVDADGQRFMEEEHPRAELAPRDIVSRAILDRMIETNSECVYLDITDHSEEELRQKFPTIFSTCEEYELDMSRDRIPVRPCAHYCMGGLKANLNGRTEFNNVYVAGEVSCTGVHGANRLASNSLLEGLIMGDQIRDAISNQELPELREVELSSPRKTTDKTLDLDDLTRSLKSLMWRRAGIIRSGEGLRKAQRQIDRWYRLLQPYRITSRKGVELANMMLLGKVIVEVAQNREESRGAHYRKDYPEPDDSLQKHSLVSYPSWSINYEPVDTS